jgi:hypothetical protein
VTRKWAPIPGYRTSSPAEKLAAALARLRDDPVECPACGVLVEPAQVEGHQGRCGARGWAGGSPLAELAAWIPAGLVRAAGAISRQALHYWVIAGRVRRRKGPDGFWLYNRADVVIALELRMERQQERTRARARHLDWLRRRGGRRTRRAT